MFILIKLVSDGWHLTFNAYGRDYRDLVCDFLVFLLQIALCILSSPCFWLYVYHCDASKIRSKILLSLCVLVSCVKFVLSWFILISPCFGASGGLWSVLVALMGICTYLCVNKTSLSPHSLTGRSCDSCLSWVTVYILGGLYHILLELSSVFNRSVEKLILHVSTFLHLVLIHKMCWGPPSRTQQTTLYYWNYIKAQLLKA